MKKFQPLVFVLLIFLSIFAVHILFTKFASDNSLFYAGTVQNLKIQTLAELPITYKDFRVFQQANGDLSLKIALSPNEKFLYVYDKQILPPRSYLIYLEDLNAEPYLFHEGNVDGYLWLENNELIVMGYDFEDGKLQEKALQLTPTTKIVADLNSSRVPAQLKEIDEYSRSSPYVNRTGPEARVYAKSKEFYLERITKDVCFLNCYTDLLGLRFFNKDDQEVGTYTFPKGKNLNSSSYGQTWFADNSFLILERQFDARKRVTFAGDAEGNNRTYKVYGFFNTVPLREYKQIWRLRKITF